MSLKKTIIFAVGGLVLVGLIVGIVLYFTVFRGNGDDVSEVIEELETFEIALGAFTTNLSDSNDFFRGEMVIETTNEDLKSEIERNNARLRDAVIKIIITKTPNDILSREGLTKLRIEIIDAISDVLDTDEITNLFFIDYIIQ